MLKDNNLTSFLFGSTRDRELRETRQAWNETQSLWRASPLAQKSLFDLSLPVLRASVAKLDRLPAAPILDAAGFAVERLLSAEDITEIEAQWPLIAEDAEVGVNFRKMLTRRRRWAAAYNQMFGAFSRITSTTLQSFFESLPESCFAEMEPNSGGGFEVPLIDLLDNPEATVERLLMMPYDDDTFRLDLFFHLRELSAGNLLEASGFLRNDNIHKRSARLVGPTKQKNKTGAELAELYLSGSPLKELLDVPIPFRIPDELRFEHCHIVGGTGHGKTQLMQKLIHADLVASQKDYRSVIVIDSQGDLINKLVHLDLFSPETSDSLADRLVIVDPADVEFPAALNLFDAHLDRVRGYSAADRERVLNGVVELYELFFGAFLGAELTQKQGVVFKYLARLMLAIPGATIHTLMKIMEDGKPFKSYMDQLDGSAKYFFQTEFFHPAFAATKKQVLRRLWGVLSTPAFERMFTQPKNKLDLFEAMNEGKIILVSTAKDLLKREGSQLLGRFFIAMITQAALERQTLREHLRNPTYVYVDEAQEYFDDSVETILNQARKYRIGFACAHQTLDQLSPRLRSAMFTNTSVKCAGGVSAKDARLLADELHTTAAFIESMKRRGPRSDFALWVKNLTGQAIRLTVPLGFLESQPTLTNEDYDTIVATNRERYCGKLSDVPTLSPTPTSEPETSSQARRPTKSPDSDQSPDSGPSKTVEKQDVAQPASRPVSRSAQDLPAKLAEDLTAPPPQSASPPIDSASTSTDEVSSATSTPSMERAPRTQVATSDREMGKGGRQHKYLQSIAKELSEQYGLKATIEAPSKGGGQVDVLIERDGILAAIEISVTTPVEHERENLQKCLDAGFPRIAVVLAKSKKAQTSYRAALSEIIPDGARERVSFLTPEELPSFIASLAPPPEPNEHVVKGYRVKSTFKPIEPEEARARQAALAKLITKSLINTKE